METETFLILAVEPHYLSSDQAATLFDTIAEVSKMLNALRARLQPAAEA